jgi:hypothetical protein
VSDESKPTAAPAPDDEPVPKLPRGRGLKLSGPQIVRIFMTLCALVGVIVLARPCASSVSNFVMGYSQGSDTAKLPKPDNVAGPEQVRAAQAEHDGRGAEGRDRAVEGEECRRDWNGRFGCVGFGERRWFW